MNLDEEEVVYVLESVEVGEEKYQLYQLGGEDFNKSCLTSDNNVDATGLRVHAGAHVAIRALRHLLYSIEEFATTQSIIEVGAGVGIVGLISLFPSNSLLQQCKNKTGIENFVLTDGNQHALALARQNAMFIIDHPKQSSSFISSLSSLSSSSSSSSTFTPELSKAILEANVYLPIPRVPPFPTVSCELLLWGAKAANDHHGADFIRQKYNGGKKFDLVVGSELMYYRTDCEALLQTVVALTQTETFVDIGLFFHTHVFRREGQSRELIDCMEKVGWMTLEIPIAIVVSAVELAHHPEVRVKINSFPLIKY